MSLGAGASTCVVCVCGGQVVGLIPGTAEPQHNCGVVPAPPENHIRGLQDIKHCSGVNSPKNRRQLGRLRKRPRWDLRGAGRDPCIMHLWGPEAVKSFYSCVKVQ